MKAQFEKVPISPDNSFHIFLYEGKNFAAPWHFHPEYELTYILKGEGTRYVGDSVQEFGPGDFVLLGSNLPHCWKNFDTESYGVRSIVIQWDDELLGKDWLLKTEFKNIDRMLQNASQGIRFSYFDTFMISSYLKDILNSSPFEKLWNFIGLLENLSSFNEFELLTSEGFFPNLNKRANDRMDIIYEYVHKNYQTKINLYTMASLVSMSEEAFCRFFKNSLNKTFFAFLNEYRINRACKLLIETNKQVGEIAHECGYESLPFFYRQFQKFIESSPLEYKNRHIASEN